MLEEKELLHRRYRLKETLKSYQRKHYDGRILVQAYLECIKILQERYHRPIKTTRDWANPDYWDKETNRDMQHKNQNPIIEVKDFQAIRRPRAKVPNKAPVIQTIPPKDSYYKIVVSWTEREGADYELVQKVEQFFNELGLERCHTEQVLMGSVCEHTIEYKFKGTEEGYKLLKRSAMTMIDIFNNQNFEIAIYGKKFS